MVIRVFSRQLNLPINITRSYCPQLLNVGSMLAHHLRRWPNIEPTLGKRLVFAGRGFPETH